MNICNYKTLSTYSDNNDQHDEARKLTPLPRNKQIRAPIRVTTTPFTKVRGNPNPIFEPFELPKPTFELSPYKAACQTPDDLNMKEKNNPNVWGPKFWFSIHNGAAHYPVDPAPIVQERTKNFIKGLPYMLPCEKCQYHAIAYIESRKHELEDICSSREKLFDFYTDMHNHVNQRYGKPTISRKESKNMYMNE